MRKSFAMKRNTSGDGIHFNSLISSVLACDYAAVDHLLNGQYVGINSQSPKDGLTALMAASGRGLEGMVIHLLCKGGVDLSLVDSAGRSAFDHARIYPRIVKILMREKHPRMNWQEPNLRPV